MSTQASIPGVFSPVLTPFDEAYRPALGRYVKHCRWLREQSVGLAIFGTNSEANSLALSEKRSLLDALLEAGVEPSALMPGTGACALPDAIELTRHAVHSGSMGVLVLPPFYYKGVSDEGLFRYYAELIEGVGDDRLRMYLYHIPPVSQVPLSLDLIDRLLDRYPGQVAGVKDSGGDWNNTAAMIERFAPRGFQVYAGSEAFLLQTLRAGGVGCITATGNVNPGPIVALQQRWQEADADARQAGLNATRNVFGKFPMIPAMKAAIAWKSGDPAWATVRPPLVELNAEQRSALQAALNDNGFDMPGADSLADN
ncbi:dihydrodipicolinate synthase family protein [Achromobacter insolitus]|uniref:dihydrodipicolinate synthase family protein n=1 Tax=Achromobacter TaxID=222 RepID=UPI0007C77D02|nr:MULTISPECIES: dihydrodipicolinate synthase family protein [Achromobacter]AXA74789.1 dihydrodipicolinate synthase family protein [Achromobacter insolitus]MCP1405022.1 4-hydroxy-tetrahydrodipicolinate synthase [Achromobacter insolitus]MEB3096116.1 dihydrodipicolinate synthase family protein [Achromobacter sp. D10]OAE65164.1 dihydrodipicolinate synthase family protein [Achromobacter insolitus]OCZ56815.1 dihydrodipicolinate synthase family protein [Achromobacter insolitus]